MNLFEKAIVKAIHQYFIQNNIKLKKSNDFLVTLSEYFHYITKWIHAQKRKVIISKELQSKIDTKQIESDYIEIIYKFKLDFESGVDITGHLSKQIYNGDYYDKLLICWGIYHLHLNTNEAHNKNEMSNNRSDMLLFCIVNDNNVYFLDAERHNKHYVFSMFNLLNIISNNWISLINKYEMREIIRGTLQPVIKDDKTLHEFRKLNINIAYEIGNKYYMFLDKGLTGAGTSTGDTMNILQIRNKIINIYPRPPIYIKNVQFDLDKLNGHLGSLSWYEGNNKKQVILWL